MSSPSYVNNWEDGGDGSVYILSPVRSEASVMSVRSLRVRAGSRGSFSLSPRPNLSGSFSRSPRPDLSGSFSLSPRPDLNLSRTPLPAMLEDELEEVNLLDDQPEDVNLLKDQLEDVKEYQRNEVVKELDIVVNPIGLWRAVMFADFPSKDAPFTGSELQSPTEQHKGENTSPTEEVIDIADEPVEVLVNEIIFQCDEPVQVEQIISQCEEPVEVQEAVEAETVNEIVIESVPCEPEINVPTSFVVSFRNIGFIRRTSIPDEPAIPRIPSFATSEQETCDNEPVARPKYADLAIPLIHQYT